VVKNKTYVANSDTTIVALHILNLQNVIVVYPVCCLTIVIIA